MAEEETQDIESQLDALLAEIEAENPYAKPKGEAEDAAASEPDAGEAEAVEPMAAVEAVEAEVEPAPEAGEEGEGGDVAGLDLANQIQQLLDEAKEEAEREEPEKVAGVAGVEESQVKPVSEDVVNEEEAADQVTEVGEDPGKRADLVSQIDELLAENAEKALAGDFESVDEVLAEEEQGGVEAEAYEDAPGADAFLDDEEMGVEAAVNAAEAELAAEEARKKAASEPVRVERAAPEVGAEASRAEVRGESEPEARPRTMGVAAVAAELDALEREEEEAQAAEAVVVVKKPKGAGGGLVRKLGWGMVGCLELMNRPFQRISLWTRNLMGFVGVMNVFLATVLMAWVVVGPVVALAAGLGLMLALFGLFYWLFVRKMSAENGAA